MRSTGTPIFGRLGIALAAAAVIAAFALRAANAQGAQFYAGKSIDLEIGYSVGGGYDLYARLLARHLGDHIAGHPIPAPPACGLPITFMPPRRATAR